MCLSGHVCVGGGGEPWGASVRVVWGVPVWVHVRVGRACVRVVECGVPEVGHERCHAETLSNTVSFIPILSTRNTQPVLSRTHSHDAQTYTCAYSEFKLLWWWQSHVPHWVPRCIRSRQDVHPQLNGALHRKKLRGSGVGRQAKQMSANTALLKGRGVRLWCMHCCLSQASEREKDGA